VNAWVYDHCTAAEEMPVETGDDGTGRGKVCIVRKHPSKVIYVCKRADVHYTLTHMCQYRYTLWQLSAAGWRRPSSPGGVLRVLSPEVCSDVHEQ
jgi:hypothetical protein